MSFDVKLAICQTLPKAHPGFDVPIPASLSADFPSWEPKVK